MALWTRKRWITFITHLSWALLPIVLALYSSFSIWEWVLGNTTLAISMLLLIEGSAIFGLVMYLTHTQSPFTYIRHMQPLLASVSTGVKTSMYLTERWGSTNTLIFIDIAGGVIAGIIVGIIVHACLRTVEDCFIDKQTLVEEKTRQDLNTVIDMFHRHTTQGIELGKIRNERLLEAKQETIEQSALTTEALIIKDDPRTIKDFRALGLSVKYATEAMRRKRSGEEITAEWVETHKKK